MSHLERYFGPWNPEILALLGKRHWLIQTCFDVAEILEAIFKSVISSYLTDRKSGLHINMLSKKIKERDELLIVKKKLRREERELIWKLVNTRNLERQERLQLTLDYVKFKGRQIDTNVHNIETETYLRPAFIA